MGSREEKITAGATGVGGFGVQAIPTLLAHFGLEPTPAAWTAFAVISGLLIAISLGLCAQLVWRWLGRMSLNLSTRMLFTVLFTLVVSACAVLAWKLGVQPMTPPPPAADGQRAAVQKTRPLPLGSGEQRPLRPPPPRVVIIQRPENLPRTSVPQSSATEVAKDWPKDFTDQMQNIRRKQVGFEASLECSKKGWALQAGLGALSFQAATKENVFHDTGNAKAMVKALDEWLPKAKKYLDDNKDQLPDTSVFDIANVGNSPDLLFRPGLTAWAIMDAKRKAIEAIMKSIEQRPCEAIGKAAIAECVADKKC